MFIESGRKIPFNIFSIFRVFFITNVKRPGGG